MYCWDPCRTYEPSGQWKVCFWGPLACLPVLACAREHCQCNLGIALQLKAAVHRAKPLFASLAHLPFMALRKLSVAEQLRKGYAAARSQLWQSSANRQGIGAGSCRAGCSML